MSTPSDLILRCESNPAPLSPWEAAYLDRVRDWRGKPSPRQIATLERIANRIAPGDIARLLAERIEDVALALTGSDPSYKHGNSIRYGSRYSLSIVVRGDKRGTWILHETKEGGDALGLVAHLRGQGHGDAIQWSLRFLGIGDGQPLPAPAYKPAAAETAEPRDTLPIARQIWREAIPAKGSLVETYLRSRGLVLPSTPVLRFHPACARGKERLPAMVALMTDAANGEPVGIHRTYLRQDGQGKAEGQTKMMLGGVGVIRLCPDDEVTTGLGVAEGIETALSIIQVARWSPVWAATSAGAISTFPALPGIEALTIFADADAAGDKAASACAARWTDAGREVTVHRAPPGQDWNDIGRAA